VAQGIEDGGLLTVAVGDVEDGSSRLDDDVAEALAELVDRDAGAWTAEHGRRAAWCAGVLALGLGALGLVVQRGSSVAGPIATTVAVALVVGASAVSRARRESGAAVALGALGATYAAVAGLILSTGSVGSAVAAGGGAALLAGLVCLVGLRAGRASALPAVVVGAILLVAGLVGRLADLDPAVLPAAGLVAVVLASTAFPGMTLALTGTAARHLDERDAPVDRARLADDARLAQEILIGLSASVGVLLVLVAPLAVSLGPAGAALAGLCSVGVMVRTRRYRSGAQVLAGLAAGAAGLAATVLTALWLQPGWRPGLTLALCALGAVALGVAVLRPVPGTAPRLAWLAGLLEAAVLLALLPVLVVAGGVFTALRS
jgi:type VII secretion integral membrane protein EccD